MKKCPYCFEEVQDEAVKCKHCGELLDNKMRIQEKKAAKPKTGIFMKSLNFGCGSILVIIAVIFVIMMVVANSNSNDSSTSTIRTSTKQDVVANPVFDIPALVGKNIDEVVAVLGKPTSSTEPTDLQISGGVTEWDKSWKKDGQELLVTYNVKTKKIADFFIPTDDPSGMTDNTARLLSVGNLNRGAGDYTIEFVKARKDQSKFTGVKVAPR